MNVKIFYVNPPGLVVTLNISEAERIIGAFTAEYKHSDEDDKMIDPLTHELREALYTLSKIKDRSQEENE